MLIAINQAERYQAIRNIFLSKLSLIFLHLKWYRRTWI